MSNHLHHTDCLAQNANTLFGDPGPCCCPKGWPRKAKAPKAPANPCYGATLTPVGVPTTHWAAHKLFTPSTKQLAAYAASQKHAVPQKRTFDDETGETSGRDTFGDDALRDLRLQYKTDPLYPCIENWRILQIAAGRYLSKMRTESLLVGADGRLRDEFRHSPKTLRLAMSLLMLLPRPLDKDESELLPPAHPKRVYDAIRKCFVPSPGHEFIAADFSGIEPLLVAYLMKDAAYLRACRLGSHSWITAFVVGHPIDIMTASDADVKAHFADLAARGTFKVNKRTMSWKAVRVGCKTTHMASLYLGGAREIYRANPDLFTNAREVQYLQDMICELVPLRQWHQRTAEECERVGYLTAPSGFRCHGQGLIARRYSKVQGKWLESMTRVAKELIAAVPQHCGMLYTATATLALERERPDLAQWLRLLIHDEVFCEVPVAVADELAATLVSIMQRPHPLMPLWPEASAVMGGATHLSVGVEVKRSRVNWGDMA